MIAADRAQSLDEDPLMPAQDSNTNVARGTQKVTIWWMLSAAMSVLGILQYMPVFAARFSPSQPAQ